MKDVAEDLRVYAHKEAAIAAIDEHSRKGENGTFDVNGERFAYTEGGSTANLIAGVALGDCRLTRRHGFCANLTG